jgi:aryl-alcohol dehydrogenase-like predicted oxidoreductase
MAHPMVEKTAALVLGCVQLGLAYGAANKTGKPSAAAAISLLRRAAERGIARFDTARAYGDSEDRLGEAFSGHRAGIITKLSPLSGLSPDASPAEAQEAADASVMASLAALRRERLDCLLLHRAMHRTSHGGAIWQRLLEHCSAGRIAELGVSVQSPEEALAVLGDSEVRHIQMPFNFLDWRWREAMEACRKRPEVTVHVRSVFLQGLLTAGDPAIWPHLAGVEPEQVLALVTELVRDLGRDSAADLCLAYARGQGFIDGVVVGVETEVQLDDNLRLAGKPPLSQEDVRRVEERVPRLPEQLLNPALWPKP